MPVAQLEQTQRICREVYYESRSLGVGRVGELTTGTIKRCGRGFWPGGSIAINIKDDPTRSERIQRYVSIPALIGCLSLAKTKLFRLDNAGDSTTTQCVDRSLSVVADMDKIASMLAVATPRWKVCSTEPPRRSSPSRGA